MLNTTIKVAQRKRGGPITHRSQDRNLALIDFLFVFPFLIDFCFFSISRKFFYLSRLSIKIEG